MLLLLFLLIVFVPVVWFITTYNGLVRLRNQRENSFADIDVVLRQRHDLVPQWVETVKGYATHERDVLTKITEARSMAAGARGVDDRIAAEEKLGNLLSGIRVQLEAYPELKANTNFLKLQSDLQALEEKLAAGRNIFNRTTTVYNNAVETFPGNVVAGWGNFKREILFEIPSERRATMEEPPVVRF